MEKKIHNAISLFLQLRHSKDDKSAKKDAANYFADSYEEYLALLDHLDKYERRLKNA
jgi:hypothetical protein